jgi:hypothetical protein
VTLIVDAELHRSVIDYCGRIGHIHGRRIGVHRVRIDADFAELGAKQVWSCRIGTPVATSHHQGGADHHADGGS